jgi:hypothetical protein
MKRFLALLAFTLAFSVASTVRASASEPASVPSSNKQLVASLVRQAPGLSSRVLKLALQAAQAADARGLLKRPDVLTVIDYSLPSSKPRLFVFDLVARKLLFRELVAHGRNSGGNLATVFSNSPGSMATSLGLFVTANTYFGGNGYSLRLRGLEEGINDMAWDRAVVMHGASYVSQNAIRALGRLGRSWGCPAVRTEIAQKIIDTIRDGSALFAYYPEKTWLATSAFVQPLTGSSHSNHQSR